MFLEGLLRTWFRMWPVVWSGLSKSWAFREQLCIPRKDLLRRQPGSSFPIAWTCKS